jgi:bifunctional UDP-N-acetylglucosamine pyrophosphorylase/glucosamine-1-phosphate N-acetyltransferase
MTMSNTAAIILAAGMGTRMESALPKVMHPVAGRPMVLHVLETAAALSPEKTMVVAGPEMDELVTLMATHDLTPDVAVQTERLGTGHAVMAARDVLGDFNGTVMVLYGDTPLIEAETLVALRDARTEAGADVAVLGFRPLDPGAYGRLITDEAGELIEIVEARDATEDQLLVDLCNSGVMAINGAKLGGLLDGLTNDNAKGEYYLTDIIALARANGGRCVVVEGDEEEFLGVNSRAELADAEDLMQNRLRRAALAGGATLIDPATVYFFWDTTLGRDVTVGPNVVFGPGVTIADNVQIKAFSHLEGASVAAGAIIGPFARLRPGAAIGEDAHIGNFVEIKNATIAAGAKANHLSYIGDATVGAKANIGAGTITCNYDGYTKSLTEIGAGAFIGSNTALVAPVKVGDGAVTGAGSVITKDVEADALAVTRSEQKAAAGWATKQRDRKARD